MKITVAKCLNRSSRIRIISNSMRMNHSRISLPCSNIACRIEKKNRCYSDIRLYDAVCDAMPKNRNYREIFASKKKYVCRQFDLRCHRIPSEHDFRRYLNCSISAAKSLKTRLTVLLRRQVTDPRKNGKYLIRSFWYPPKSRYFQMTESCHLFCDN